MSAQNTSRIALVTGATRGIGFETVRQLASQGVHVLLAGRDRSKAVEASLKLQSEGLPVEAVVLDVTDSASIAAAAQEVERKYGHLDILVNNAGIIRDDASKPRSAQSLQAWRETFDTNVFGLIETTQAFLPLLRKSAAGRIVNVSSALGSLALTSDTSTPYSTFPIPAYNVSKSAVNAWTVQLAHDLRDSGIKVNTIHPGYVRTDMNTGEGELEVAQGAETSVQMALLDADGPSGTFQYRGEVLPW
jgi:NAD(P)-dependent dehydrogenase (short-subunit alcohol dehydrogenase family)